MYMCVYVCMYIYTLTFKTRFWLIGLLGTASNTHAVNTFIFNILIYLIIFVFLTYSAAHIQTVRMNKLQHNLRCIPTYGLFLVL